MHHTHEKKELPILFNTNSCVDASTSPFVVAFITLTLAKQPDVATTLLSVGRRVEPQVLTSGGVDDVAELIRVNTNLKADAWEQLPLAFG